MVDDRKPDAERKTLKEIVVDPEEWAGAKSFGVYCIHIVRRTPTMQTKRERRTYCWVAVAECSATFLTDGSYCRLYTTRHRHIREICAAGNKSYFQLCTLRPKTAHTIIIKHNAIPEICSNHICRIQRTTGVRKE